MAIWKATLAATDCDICICVLDTDDVAEVPSPQQIKDSTVRRGQMERLHQMFSKQFFQFLPLYWALLVCPRFIKIFKTVLLTFQKYFLIAVHKQDHVCFIVLVKEC